MGRRGVIPDELEARLTKAEGHRNAVDRWLWRDMARGLWSAHQSAARLAEARLRLAGLLDALPPVERSLPPEAVERLLASFGESAPGGPVATAWRDLAVAEAAVRREPFPQGSDIPRDALRAGLERKWRLQDALQQLARAVKDEVAARYPNWRAVTRPMIESAVLQAPSDRLVDELLVDGSVPHPVHAARRLADEIARNLRDCAGDGWLDLSVRRDVPYFAVWDMARADGPDDPVPTADEMAESVAALVTTQGPAGPPLHVLEVFGRWEEGPCLAALRRLNRLIEARHALNGGAGTLQLAGLVCGHAHDKAAGDPPWERPFFEPADPDGPPPLRELIQAAIEAAFGAAAETSVRFRPAVSLGAFDRLAFAPGIGDGAMTLLFARFDAFPAELAAEGRPAGG